jgi:CheY-like chemotaxis protein
MQIQKALVVDDSRVAHLTLRKLLMERSIEVDWVGSGKDAITYIQWQRPDVIFMDVMMPGMDGFETTAAITKNSPLAAPPIIMCSANATDEDRHNAIASGATAFLSKPYTAAEMDNVLNQVRELPPQAGVPPVTAPERPAAPAAAPPAPAAPSPTVADIERVTERTAWSIADKVAREVTGDLARSVSEKTARHVAEHTVRSMIEEMGRKTAHAAVQTAQRAAADIARSIVDEALRELRSASAGADQTLSPLAEEIARTVSEDTTRKQLARSLPSLREELAKSFEQQVSVIVQEQLKGAISSQEF